MCVRGARNAIHFREEDPGITPRTIEVTELALRDGHQSLLATRMAL